MESKMLIKSLDTKLALKLGDPVSANDDGGLFSKELRLSYLQGAINSLRRILPKLMREYAPNFSQELIYHSQNFDNSNDYFIQIKIDNSVQSLEDVKEVFVDVKNIKSNSTTKVKASFRNPKTYLSLLTGNSGDDPSFDENNIFYTFLDSKIYFAPKPNGVYSYLSIELVMKRDLAQLSMESSIAVPREYEELILTIAAAEGMQDIGRIDKVNIYNGYINNQLGILKNYADFREAKEGSEVNG